MDHVDFLQIHNGRTGLGGTSENIVSGGSGVQGFPPDYAWIGNQTAISQMIANAMPVELAESIAASLVNN